jgi:hypothetical protein
MKCLICKGEISDWRKTEIHIRTLGRWTKRKHSFYSTVLKPVCYGCVERMNFQDYNSLVKKFNDYKKQAEKDYEKKMVKRNGRISK